MKNYSICFFFKLNLYYFFPISVVSFFFLKKKFQQISHIFLILISFIFYGFSNKEHIPLLFFSISLNIIFYKLISLYKNKFLLFCIIFINLAILFFYKYILFTFTLFDLNFIIERSFVVSSLPVGISFFTFQQIAYQVDRYNHKEKKCSILDYFLFVSFFPNL